MIKKILITKNAKRFYVHDESKDLHTQFGMIKAKQLKRNKGKVKSNTGKEFFIMTPNFTDKFARIKRLAQIVTLKDIATIIIETGVNKESKIVDAGAGSGALACALANICKQVTTYEIRKPFIKIVKENKNLFALKNLKIKNKNIYKKIDEKNIDLITLDLPEPVKALNSAAKSLKVGGFLVAYLPQITQVIEFVKQVDKHKNLVYLKTLENIQRRWAIDGRIARPESMKRVHTAFIVFARKI
ncbi:methyltransferase domain-containing protein [Candidatus Woesearchaeota archaeon]|nr:methyltransferase domain-containing protein [Candidatus Woesearchaeota archaeon]